MLRALVFALLSGIPALVYQVVWTREVALAVAGQIEAVSVVVAAFFGGLALGARVLGPRADRLHAPLRLYAGLEIAAGVLALASPWLLRALGAQPWVGRAPGTRLALAAAGIAALTFLLGGTLPALLRSATADAVQAARHAGRLLAANTAGAVLGVGTAALAIPAFGLRATLWAAGAWAILIGLAALALARPTPPVRAASKPEAPRPPAALLGAAFVAGVATLGFEVLATRAAALRLGSSLYAWALILALFLLGLAGGNAWAARRAVRSPRPSNGLGLIQTAAAVWVAAGIVVLVPFAATPAVGLSTRWMVWIAACILPPSVLMGAAFPFLVRLGVRSSGALAGSFGALSAANTAGGIVGALAAPFVLLPTLGLAGSILLCAGLNGALALAFLAHAAPTRQSVRTRTALAAGLVALAAAPTLSGVGVRSPAGRVVFVDHGRQATAAVVRVGGRRDLVVDGDPEASTGGDARATEELLAVLPLVRHADPRSFLEIGLGSGITLATAAGFPLERIDCVEIADSVLRAARLFAPDNDAALAADPGRIRIVRADGRAWLARHPATYDVVVANTLHPWSLGATGLYSREYFERMATALRPGGVAAQWLPIERIGAEALAAILRTLATVFPEGDVWWGANNLLVVAHVPPTPDRAALGARVRDPELAAALHRLGIDGPSELARRRLASFAALRAALGPGPILSDDRPLLETLAVRGRARGSGGELALLERLARAGAAEDPRTEALRLLVEGVAAQRRGDPDRARTRLTLAEASGLDLARSVRLRHATVRATRAFSEGRLDDAEAAYRAVLAEAPDHRDARFGLAALLERRGDREAARRELARLVREHPRDGEAWNQLGVLQRRRDAVPEARAAFDRALAADPFFPEALGNAGLLAVEAGDLARARRLLARLDELAPFGATPEAHALAGALAAVP